MRDTIEHGCHGDGKLTCDFFFENYLLLGNIGQKDNRIEFLLY